MGLRTIGLKELESSFCEKCSLLKEIRDISDQQIAALQTEDLSRLTSLLQQKQSLIDRVDSVDSTTAEQWRRVQEDWGYASWGDLASDSLGRSVLDLREDIRLLLATMLEQDGEQALLGRALLLKYGHLLRELNTGASALKTYAHSRPEGQVSSVFVNRKL